MRSLLPEYVKKITVPRDISILLSLCAKAHGKEELWQRTKPEVLNALKQQAIISSTESSNRIEGVEVEPARLKPLVKGTTKPRDRTEEEIVGYREALDWIHKDWDRIDISTATIRKIHFLAQQGSVSDAGEWKTRNNEIIELHADGRVTTRFVPPEPEQVPQLVEGLCLAYRNTENNNLLPDLLLIATFVFDFLCIHPFRDGNGRTSRLLTLLLLYKHGYTLGRYVSVERNIEDTCQAYYAALQESSRSWHTSEHDLMPFWRYFVRTIKVAYDGLESRFDVQGPFHGGKTQLIRSEVMRQIGDFKLSDIVGAVPGVSQNLVQKVLAGMREEGLVNLHGHGRGAYWSKGEKS